MIGAAAAASGSSLLAKNRCYFDSAWRAAEVAARHGSVDHALEWAKLAAECAWTMHPGFYSFPPLEALLSSLSASLPQSSLLDRIKLPPRRKGCRSWLHLLTRANLIGGHTRLAERLIVNASAGSDDQHSILLIDQECDEVPPWLGEAARQTGGDLTILPQGPGLAERARLVREIARQWADAVLLHVHPNDPVAAVAFAAGDVPPVVYVNHADHVFWVGAGCADVVADIRPEGERLTRERRGGAASTMLPIPLDLPESGPSREEARRMLGLAPDDVVLLAIASGYKFAPYRHLDFQKTATELLRRHENAVLVIVGPAAGDPDWQEALSASHGRFRLFGVQPDISRFYAAADLCLESFPLGSLTATLDAMLLGVPVLRAPQGVPLFSLSSYDGLLPAASATEEYLQQAARYIEDPSFRSAAGAAQRDAIVRQHTGSGWRASWDALAASLPESHKPGGPGGGEGSNAADDLDQIWAEFQERQSAAGPGKDNIFKHRARGVVRSRPRGEILRVWLSAARRGDWRLARILLHSLRKG